MPSPLGRASQPGQPRSSVKEAAPEKAEFSRPAKPAPVSWKKSTASAAEGQKEGLPAGSGLAASGAPLMQTAYAPAADGKETLVSRDELEWRALKVEQEASKKLKNLLQVLDLPEDTQDRIFVALAKNSDYYHPLLSFQGPHGGELAPAKPKPATPLPEPETPGVETPQPQPEQPTPEAPAENHDPVLDELTPEERLAYERAEAEREEFWSGVVEEVEAQLDAPATP